MNTHMHKHLPKADTTVLTRIVWISDWTFQLFRSVSSADALKDEKETIEEKEKRARETKRGETGQVLDLFFLSFFLSFIIIIIIFLFPNLDVTLENPFIRRLDWWVLTWPEILEEECRESELFNAPCLCWDATAVLHYVVLLLFFCIFFLLFSIPGLLSSFSSLSLSLVLFLQLACIMGPTWLDRLAGTCKEFLRLRRSPDPHFPPLPLRNAAHGACAFTKTRTRILWRRILSFFTETTGSSVQACLERGASKCVDTSFDWICIEVLQRLMLKHIYKHTHTHTHRYTWGNTPECFILIIYSLFSAAGRARLFHFPFAELLVLVLSQRLLLDVCALVPNRATSWLKTEKIEDSN